MKHGYKTFRKVKERELYVGKCKVITRNPTCSDLVDCTGVPCPQCIVYNKDWLLEEEKIEVGSINPHIHQIEGSYYNKLTGEKIW